MERAHPNRRAMLGGVLAASAAAAAPSLAAALTPGLKDGWSAFLGGFWAQYPHMPEVVAMARRHGLSADDLACVQVWDHDKRNVPAFIVGDWPQGPCVRVTRFGVRRESRA